MGRFFSALYVFLGGGDGEELRGAAIDALRAKALSAQFAETEPDDPLIDCRISVGPAAGERWMLVQGSYSLGSDDPVAAARWLSGELGAAVLLADIHDSDVLSLWLCRDGALLDRYVNDPGYFGGPVSKRERQAVAGRPDVWADLLIGDAAPDQLREAWDARPVFCEDVFAQVAALLGINQHHAFGLREEDLPAATRMSFRAIKPPRYRVPMQGPPLLRRGPHPVAIRDAAGGPLEPINFTLSNVGGPGSGLMLRLSGSALGEGLIDVTGVRVRDRGSDEFIAAEMRQQDAQTVLARLQGIELPPGIIDSDQPLEQWEWRHVLRAQAQAWTMVWIDGIGLAPGRGELLIEAAPIGWAFDAQYDLTLPCVIEPRPRRPLRADPNQPNAGFTMSGRRDYVCARLTLRAPAAAVGAAFEPAFARWYAAISPPPTARYLVIRNLDHQSRNEVAELRAASIPDGRRWRSLRRSFLACADVTVRVVEGPTDGCAVEFGGRADFYGALGGWFVGSTLQFERDEGGAAPQLCLWVRPRGLPPEKIERLGRVLGEIVDELMRGLDGMQAYVCDWSEEYAGVGTAYERLCGVNGTVTESRSWGARWLRGVSERIWLGPELRALLADPGALAEVAEIAVVGDTWRVALKPGASLDELERLLAPILPGADDWRSVHDAYYADLRRRRGIEQP
ncbi:MAG TPA: hypothetical protein VGE07_11225 [Herpetosiphonaceae bacterium]